MSTQTSTPLDVEQGNDILPARTSRALVEEQPSAAAQAARAESMQRTGKRMILAGSIITILGVVSYCIVSFAGGMDADLGDILFRNAVPMARATLVVLGLGTLVWLIGSFVYLNGAMVADEGTNEDESPKER